MSSPSPTSPKRRPRLSLQIKAISGSSSVQNSRTLAAAVDLKDHTTFNTLSNVYATAIDRSTPVQERNDSWSAALSARPSLRLQTQDANKDHQLYTPYLGPYLDTPLSAQPMSPAVGQDVIFPSAIALTSTPPLSAGPVDSSAKIFTFEKAARYSDAAAARPPPTPRTSKRRSTLPSSLQALPYSHTRTLRSILRNSPLPPLSTKSPDSPRRQSVRLQEKAARRVAYNSPLCQTITTSKYIRSHIDLLTDDVVSPATPNSVEEASQSVLDITMAYTGDETRDGGQTPGPFEETRRRMASCTASSPLSPSSGGVRKKGKKKDKKRRWVWTIGEDAGDEQLVSPEIVRLSGPESLPESLPKSVPVLGMPSPGPRTRSQTSMTPASRAPQMHLPVVSAPTVPVISLPVPRPRGSAPGAASEPVAHAVGTAVAPLVSRPRPRRRLTLEVPAVKPPLSPVPRDRTEQLAGTPPGTTIAIEPPTPSVDSIMSQESVFEPSADVEMSDASSPMSVDSLPVMKLSFFPSLGSDIEMVTPIASEPSVILA